MPPKVLLLIADDHRYSATGACGDATVRTPALDGLIAAGTCFDRTYHMGSLSGAVCVPARSCLMTGVDPFHASTGTAIDDPRGQMIIRPDLPTLPQVFRAAGYHTHHIGKWHNDRASFQRSFAGADKIFFGGMCDHRHVPVHDYDPSGEYPPAARYEGDRFSTELFGEAAIRFLRSRAGQTPFFLYCAFTAPHDPRTPPAEYAALYDPVRVPLPPNYLPEHPFDNGELRVRDEQLAPFPRTPEEIRRHIADYYGMISHLDAWIGRILAALEATGQAANTIVVYTADHGLAVGQHGLLGKQNLYEHSVRVPCVLRGPGIPAGVRSGALCHTPDLFPTLCDLAGVAVPPTVESQSLAPLLRGERDRGREGVCGLYKDVQRMATDGRWKLIRYYTAARPGVAQVGTDRMQLFDLERDPWEMDDLSEDGRYATHLARLSDQLAAWQRRVEDPLVTARSC